MSCLPRPHVRKPLSSPCRWPSGYFSEIIQLTHLIGLTLVLLVKHHSLIWAASSEFGTYRLCEQRRLIRAVSPEPPLLAHTSSESRETFRQKARSLAPLNGWACAVKICHDGMLEVTNSLDVPHFIFIFSSDVYVLIINEPSIKTLSLRFWD